MMILTPLWVLSLPPASLSSHVDETSMQGCVEDECQFNNGLMLSLATLHDFGINCLGINIMLACMFVCFADRELNFVVFI